MSQSCPGSQRKVAWKLSYGGATWMLANAEIPLPVKLLGDVGGVLLTATRWPPPSWQLNLATASQRPTYRCRVFSVFRWFWICAIIVFSRPSSSWCAAYFHRPEEVRGGDHQAVWCTLLRWSLSISGQKTTFKPQGIKKSHLSLQRGSRSQNLSRASPIPLSVRDTIISFLFGFAMKPLSQTEPWVYVSTLWGLGPC